VTVARRRVRGMVAGCWWVVAVAVAVVVMRVGRETGAISGVGLIAVGERRRRGVAGCVREGAASYAAPVRVAWCARARARCSVWWRGAFWRGPSAAFGVGLGEGALLSAGAG
jgi:hypothetical protein